MKDAALDLLFTLISYAATDSAIPPKAVRDEAARGLHLRSLQSPSNRAGTAVGLARARDLANGRPISVATLKRMKAYFDRHEIDKTASGWKVGEENYPSKGLQAWLLWGGDSGRAWCLRELRKRDMLDKEGNLK
jgi:hypothetical protein